MAKKLSQEALAVDADVDTSYISRMENGLENPSIGTVERLADTLGVSFGDMFKSPKKNEQPPRPLTAGRRKRT